MKKRLAVFFSILMAGLLSMLLSNGQMITGVWKGKINNQKAEIKIIQKGDSLEGTSYYYVSAKNYRRYSIKGYLDPETNAAVWWDDQLIEENTGGLNNPGKLALLTSADFNCPGGGIMKLDGKTSPKNNPAQQNGIVHLDKTNTTSFNDEWDDVIDNYTLGWNDPYIIDSIASIAVNRVPQKQEIPIPTKTNPEPVAVASIPVPPKETATVSAEPLPTIEQKFKAREKVFTKEIPVNGDSIELRFYDNGEVDGDSISLFLNNRLIFEHIRLTEKAYTIKLPVKEMSDTNELVMVAENLGSIPPNTSYMVAIVGDKRYDAMLASSEGSSAYIRLRKE
jgi:hypothetical protein